MLRKLIYHPKQKENHYLKSKIQFLQNVKMTYFLTIVNLNLLNVKHYYYHHKINY
ncbi:hypothetical protein C1646_731903, partial [Rhizophagus diaphanus]